MEQTNNVTDHTNIPQEIWSIILKDTMICDLLNTSLVCNQFNQILQDKRNSSRRLYLYRFVKPFYPKNINEQQRKEEGEKYQLGQVFDVWYYGKKIGYVKRNHCLILNWGCYLYLKDTLWYGVHANRINQTIIDYYQEIKNKFKTDIPTIFFINNFGDFCWAHCDRVDEKPGNYTNLQKAIDEIKFMYFVVRNYPLK